MSVKTSGQMTQRADDVASGATAISSLRMALAQNQDAEALGKQLKAMGLPS